MSLMSLSFWKRYSFLRRWILLLVIFLFLLQFLRIKFLIGGLSGSLFLSWVKILDPFAFLESLVASKTFTIDALWATIPVILVYLIFGRAFCGWVCPMDLLFSWVNRLKRPFEVKFAEKIPSKVGFIIAGLLLLLSFLIEIPIFSNYLSHLTNFFRSLTALVFLIADLPVDLSLFAYSVMSLIILLILEFCFPRLWCRVLCPVGKIYGLFNKVSLLHLRYKDGECLQCASCDKVCYMKVKISQNIERRKLRSQDCIFCGNCVETCEGKAHLIKFKLGV
ncbi:MAG: 4Fe-4S binding protein [Caldimicrobium sp.]|nr:4Fe-4S binding protein [Caldimicrobium sp.]MCX7613937.1 4Fe-4S binding protein [Caldimicrobium sp.]MDW8182020.1 4Fe-4S binding protein [Caldimicrobium sp.]